MDSEQPKARRRERDRTYRQRPDVKAKIQEYVQRPDVKARRQKWGRAYRQRPDVKAKQQARQEQRRDPKFSRLLRMKLSFRRKAKKGYVYLFESITPGFLKVGCTINWKMRQVAYNGPAAVGRMLYLGKHDHMFHTETMFKVILEEMGFKKCGRKAHGDWYVKSADVSDCGRLAQTE